MEHYKRQKDIIKLIDDLDISPTMFKNAVEKYKALAAYLQRHGIDSDIYPQGSFALGTVVRPLRGGEEAAYDLDFICQVNASKETTDPKPVYDQLKSALLSSDEYSKKITPFSEGFMIEYADIGSISFSIDIVPAVDEAEETKASLVRSGLREDVAQLSIAIPRERNEHFDWISNNPRGYKTWFDEINAPFLNYSRYEYRSKLFEENRSIFASIADIPEELDRSAVQRAIQILKQHRNAFYEKVTDGDEIKPISAIISTIVCSVASKCSINADPFDLIDAVTKEVSSLKHLLNGSGARGSTASDADNDLIKKKNGKWILLNPANPMDNLMNAWSDNSRTAPMFFMWIDAVRNDLIDSLSLNDAEFREAISNGFGKEYVNRKWNGMYTGMQYAPITTGGQNKPWKTK